MTSLKEPTLDDIDFIKLSGFIRSGLAIKRRQRPYFYNQFNKVDKIKHVVVYYRK